MKTTKKTKRRHGRPARSRQQLAQCGAVGVAVAREEMRRHMLDFSISLFLRDDGADAADLLPNLAWVLAIGSEIAAEKSFGSPEARSIHAALRTVIHMSMTGNRWQAAQAPVLQAAATAAHALLSANPVQPVPRRDDADWIASRVQAGIATLADVAGPELYQRPLCPAGAVEGQA